MSRNLLHRLTEDCFHHLGIDATYTGGKLRGAPIRVLPIRSSQDYEIGDATIVADVASFEIRMSDVIRPLPGHRLKVEGVIYRIDAEPVKQIERSTWEVEAIRVR